jgi:hypothetical protein
VIIDAAAKGTAVLSDAPGPSWLRWDEFVAEGARAKRGRTPDGDIAFAQLPFDWPLWILFSSVRHARSRLRTISSHPRF